MQELIDVMANQGIAVGLCVYLLYERHKEQVAVRAEQIGVRKTMNKISDGLNEMVIILRERMPDHKISPAVC